jgi:hypothetical protein
MQLSGKSITGFACHLTEGEDVDGVPGPRRFRIVDKHGLSRVAYNLQIDIELEGKRLSLGLDDSALPHREPAGRKATTAPAGEAPSAEELFDDLASLLKKRSTKKMVED